MSGLDVVQRTDSARRSAWPIIAAAFLATVLGIVAAMGHILLLAAVGGGFLVVGLVVWTRFLGWSVPQFVVIAIIGLFFLLEVIFKSIGLPLFGYWQAGVLLLGFLGLKRLWKEVARSLLLKLSALAFAGFLLLAIVSTFFAARSTLFAALYQFVSDLKLPLALAFGIFIGSKTDLSLAIERTIVWFPPIATVFLLLQWGAPSVYLAIFSASHVPLDKSTIFPSLGLSIFNHPSILAAVSAMLAIYSFGKWQILKTLSGYGWAAMLALIFLLIASYQRQEIFSLILAVTCMYVLASKKRFGIRVWSAVVLVVVFLSAYMLVFGDTFKREASMWGITSFQAATHPRAELYLGAVNVAQTNFPLGSGLGTYGGAGSSKYDLSLFYELGFARNWWWGKEDFLLDTYWPNSLAESGVVGATFLLIHYLLFAFYAFRKAYCAQNARARMFWLCAAGSFSWVLLNTPTSPGFQEMRLIFFPALMFGIAVNFDRRSA